MREYWFLQILLIFIITLIIGTESVNLFQNMQQSITFNFGFTKIILNICINFMYYIYHLINRLEMKNDNRHHHLNHKKQDQNQQSRLKFKLASILNPRSGGKFLDVKKDKSQIGRYRRFSQPQNYQISPNNSKATIQNIRHSLSISKGPNKNQAIDIYFDTQKKSKFMKNIVDGYFEDTIKDPNDVQDHKQVKNMIKNINSIVKNKKNANSLTFRGSLAQKESHPEEELISKRRFFQNDRIKYEKKKTMCRSGQINSQKKTKLFSDATINEDNNEIIVPIQSELTLSVNLTGQQGTYLQPIQEINQEFIPNQIQTQYFSDNKCTVSGFLPQLQNNFQLKDIQIKQNKEQILLYQNQIFRIYIMLQDSKPICRLKQFKNQGIQILKRQERARKLGVETLWKQSQISSNCFLSKLVHPLKNMICRILPNLQNNSNNSNINNKGNTAKRQCKFKVKSTNYRKYLLSNNCLELKHIMREVCLILKKYGKRIVNNKVNPSNLFILKGNKVVLGQWGSSSFRDEYQIQYNKFQSRVNPILKSQSDWLTTPQYLSPEILMAISAQSEEQEPNIWDSGIASDIWSLGLTIFQILTMIPIWINDPCMIKFSTKKEVGSVNPILPSNSPQKNYQSLTISTSSVREPLSGSHPTIRRERKPRIGLLATEKRTTENILQRQEKLQKMIRKCLQTQIEEEIDPVIIQLVSRMVKFQASERIDLETMLEILK